MSSLEEFDYISETLPPAIVEKLEAAAFRSLCAHLRERSDQVQNIDLMTLSGFCRNCLAKWMVVEARRLTSDDNDNIDLLVKDSKQALDALGYDEAARYVYGMEYGEWKKKHSKKASDEQMQKYNDSKPLWATHDKELLATRAEKPILNATTTTTKTTTDKESNDIESNNNNNDTDETKQDETKAENKSLLSNVCCQDVDTPTESATKNETVETKTPSNNNNNNVKKAREVPPFQPPAPPTGGVSFTLGVLTVSDRASTGSYETGDLSGPAVVQAVTALVNDSSLSNNNNKLETTKIETAIVPDNIEDIQNKLKEWADTTKLDLVLTTGGTGFAPRDVTPEATRGVLDKENTGLLSFVTAECSKIQPLASLSRGTAGLRGKTLIANLPGNPKGVEEVVPVLVPLAIHAIADVKAAQRAEF